MVGIGAWMNQQRPVQSENKQRSTAETRNLELSNEWSRAGYLSHKKREREIR